MTTEHTIHRLGIVNRGEAAMRCIRAVKSLRAQEGNDLQVIALYTEVDRDAPFVRQADDAILLPSPNGAVAAYLDHEGVVAALRAMQVDAVWPGWGFVAESPAFVERLAREGIVFLGPSAEAMRELGDKITSKELAEAAEVPVTPWSGGVLQDAADAERHAAQIGYPIAIKASAGGGGRGIRMVDQPSELVAAFESAQSEAQNAFGDGRLFCEKRVSLGRHIEVQIAGDRHGNVLAVGCRDCSLQRRHQKVIEEAPPPGLARGLREAIETAALRVASHVAYRGVGTVEFLLAGDEFYFLEVNPRLQVEHGITEEVTGVDLVQLQIRIARGESIKDVRIVERGVSLEARVCAEDPDANFLPAPGRIARFEPSLGPRIRIDTGVSAGSTVPPDFDSLVVKVLASGDDREEARARLSCALRDFELVVRGGATNKGYLLEILDSPEFRAGPVDTGWLDRWGETRIERSRSDLKRSQDGLVAAAILAYQRARRAAREHFYADSTAISADRIPPAQGQQVDLSHEGESYRLMVYAIGSWGYRVHLDGSAVGATMREEGEHLARLEISGRVRRILYDATEMRLRLEIDGHPLRFGWQTAGQVSAGTPAMVVGIHVEVGDRVEAGQALGLVEAMKMEISFEAPVAGVVTEIRVRKGQQVSAGEVLLVIDPASEDGEAAVESARLMLPEQADPLALLFREENGNPLAVPDIAAADDAGPGDVPSDLEPEVARALVQAAEVARPSRRVAVDTVRDEVRRVLLGYDANRERGESLVAFLEAPLPPGLSEVFRRELAEIRADLSTFADVERLFITAPRLSVSGDLGPSNNARLRMYVRRLRAGGAGIAEEFLDLLRAAVRHYGVTDLTPSDALERGMLRLLSSQFQPELRRRLALGMMRRLVQLVESGIDDMAEDTQLRTALDEIARMRGLLPDAVADAALEARYVTFERPEFERQAEQSSKALQAWLDQADVEFTAPSTGVMLEIAAAARRVFDRVGSWLTASHPGQRDLALAAHVQRAYAPRLPKGHQPLWVEGTWIHCVEYPDCGLVLAATGKQSDLAQVASRLSHAGHRFGALDGGPKVYALELMVSDPVEIDESELEAMLQKVNGKREIPCRLTLGFLEGGQHEVYKTFTPLSGGIVLRRDLHDLHPETATRIGLARLSAFELEKIPSEEGIYSFHGKSRDVPGDERVFVLADARDRSPSAGPELANHIVAFERVFNRAARSLRTTLQVRDPRRGLQWNRIQISVAPEILVHPEQAAALSRKLLPATRHLGLEKVIVRLNLLDPDAPDQPAKPVEIVATDTGPQMDLSYRQPHGDPLEPAQDYERRVVAARRRRRVYPYEIVRMLTSSDRNLVGAEGEDQPFPSGHFEEYDLDEHASMPVAKSVADRPPGKNRAAIVFGVISTPTEKVPEGMKRVLVLSDPTMGMGALAQPECDRIVAAIDLAEQLGVPVEWVPVSSGAKIAMDSGTENLDATARVVRRIVTFTNAGGVIHIIVQGVNVGAQSYFDALATMLMHTRGVLIMTPRASMVLTGRAALEASGAVAAEDETGIGGYERIMGPNGQAQYYARNLAEAYRILYDHYRYSYVVPGEVTPRRFETSDPPERSICSHPLAPEEAFDFATVGEIFDDETNPGRKRPFAMRAVMAALIDQDGGRLERWPAMVGAETAIVWDTHLGGIPVSMIGIESHSVPREGYRPVDGPEVWTGGTLFPLSSKKVARAINGASGNRPLVIVANLSGFDGTPESMRKLQLEYGAEIARAVVNFEGPVLFCVVSRYHGGAYVVFSQELNDSLEASALDGSYASVIGGGPAAKVVFSREVQAQAVSDERVAARERELRRNPSPEAREEFERLLADVTLEKQAEVAAQFDGVHSVERAREVGSLSKILPPDRMRATLIADLRAALDRGAK